MTGILDQSVLAELANDIGDQAARQFTDLYRAALGRRLDVLAFSAASGNAFATYEAAAGLASASAMVGATPLAQTAWAVARDAMRNGTVPQTETLQELKRLARDTETALARQPGDDDPDPPQAPSSR